jgi:hypothetical protein
MIIKYKFKARIYSLYVESKIEPLQFEELYCPYDPLSVILF